MTFRIFVDSGLNLTDDLLDRYGIEAISYTARLDGEEFLCYEKGRDYEAAAKRYYAALRQGKPAATSLINTATIEEVVAPALERGEDALFIPISSGVSGTYRQAQIAAEEMASRYAGKLYVLDSLSASFGAGMLAVRGAELRREGKSAEETLRILDELKWQVAQYFTVDDLEYLKRGGRISTVAAIIGSLLKVKPLLRGNDEGKIVLASKVVGRRKVLHALADAYVNMATDPQNQTLWIAHGDCEEEALAVAKEIKERAGYKELIIRQYDLCTGTHVGPGTIAIFFYCKRR